jgi:hypothetical protein
MTVGISHPIVEPWSTIPGEAIEVATDRMDGSFLSPLVNCLVDLLAADLRDAAVLQPFLQLTDIGISERSHT